jgi:UDP-glucose 4-epimerase
MLIFGGTGFLGKHLCVMLHETGRVPAAVVSRDPDLAFLKAFAPSVGAVKLADFLSGSACPAWDGRNIIYLAGSSTPGTFAATPWKEYSDNVAPAFEVFNRLQDRFPDARIVFVSSGGTVYGQGHDRPISETALLAPISPYGLGKVALESSLDFLGRTRGLGFEILRVSNPVGRWQTNPSQGVINVMARAIAGGQPITLFGDGGHVRDFLDADEAVSAIVGICDLPDATNSAWNIGSGVGTSIAEVVTFIEKHFHQSAVKQFLPARALDVAYSVLDCSKASSRLGWSAKVSVDQMVAALATRMVSDAPNATPA